jgi:RNA polymerase sigma-70 factor (ECF subfamily)
MSDDALIGRIRGGDQAAFEEFVRRHERGVYGYLRARLRDHARAAELTGQVFRQFLESGEKSVGMTSAGPALIDIARTILQAHDRRDIDEELRRWTDLCREVDRGAPSEVAEPGPEALSECLGRLTSSARQALELAFTANLGTAELAARLKRSEGATRSLLAEARRTLKHCFNSRRQRAL